MKQVVAIGELLIDFVPQQKGVALPEVTHFERAAGGAPANAVRAVSRLGGNAAMLSQVGDDAFGTYILNTLAADGVDTAGVFRTDKARTGLAFVSLDETGNREFAFFRNPSADLLLTAEQAETAMPENCAALHFCSVDLVDWPVREAHRKAIALAKSYGALVSFDPNVRLPLWENEQACAAAIREFLPAADLVKLSDDEVLFVTGYPNEQQAAEVLFEMGCKLLLVTRGGNGAAAYTPHAQASVSTPLAPVTDTTGAGDSFIGSFLFQLVRDGVAAQALADLSAEQLTAYLRFSTRYASLTVQKKGAAMASMEEFNAAFAE